MAVERLGQYSGGNRGLYEEQEAGRIQQAYEQTEAMVRRHPGSSALVSFAIGFGLGLAFTAMLAPPVRRRRWYEDYVPEGLSRNQLAETISRMLPEAISRRVS